MVGFAGGIPGRVIWLWCNVNHIARDFQPATAETHVSYAWWLLGNINVSTARCSKYFDASSRIEKNELILCFKGPIC